MFHFQGSLYGLIVVDVRTDQPLATIITQELYLYR